ncbi:glycerol kinase GlpK [Sphingomonas sp. HDW15A]|uniref:FGGY family carbohydrate kinase n=1 Tax=Sphingomonas sp. HDW15A TaxID=2714942 RepID=UPI00140DAD88|nr:glycerol kinase GlpK [Sphingomonas sp. HDW15A]QIK96832.1 glycerol kinase GlpK [Sphingomonas sp. HDW15A]
MDDAILVIDEGTTSTRAMLVGSEGQCGPAAQHELSASWPRPAWVEHDADEIWRLSLKAARTAASASPDSIRTIGISNQRETIVFWDRKTGEPLAPAIVWQDRRTADLCAGLREAGHEPAIQQKTGLLLDPYFSATKIAWALDHWPQLRAAGDRLAIGTIDSWLVFKLTGGLHLTDATNASRTLLMDLKGGWDEGLCDLFGVPRGALPEIVDSAGTLAATDPALFGRQIPICGIAGDQQAAAIGQDCLAPGDTKATFGTGAFILTHCGTVPPCSANRLLSTVAWQIDGKRAYALEGSLFVAGQVVSWLRDSLGLIARSAETAALATSVPGSEGVRFVPAFAGLGAPHWQPDARAAILGLTLGTGKAHIVRAALEGVANQGAELQRAFASDGAIWSRLRIDGGMAANDFLAQDLADLLALPVERPANVESTALGAAMLAAAGCGLYGSLREAADAMGSPLRRFDPGMPEQARSRRIAEWDRAVAAVQRLGQV